MIVKDSSGNYDNILQYIDLTDQNSFSILAGTDSLILSTLMAGGSGGIAATADFLPEATVAIYEKFINGDVEGAEQEQWKLRKLRSLFKLGSIPSVLKESLNKIGIEAGLARLPILPVNPQVELQIQQMVDDYIKEGILKLSAASSRGE